MAFAFVLVAYGRFEGFFLVLRPRAAFGFDIVATHRGQHACCLFATHHADACVGPHPQEPRRKRATAHAVIARAKTATDDDGELRHLRTRNCGDHLRAVPCDAFVFVFASDHEAGDVL